MRPCRSVVRFTFRVLVALLGAACGDLEAPGAPPLDANASVLVENRSQKEPVTGAGIPNAGSYAAAEAAFGW